VTTYKKAVVFRDKDCAIITLVNAYAHNWTPLKVFLLSGDALYVPEGTTLTIMGRDDDNMGYYLKVKGTEGVWFTFKEAIE
jgi:hypothetical protein